MIVQHIRQMLYNVGWFVQDTYCHPTADLLYNFQPIIVQSRLLSKLDGVAPFVADPSQLNGVIMEPMT